MSIYSCTSSNQVEDWQFDLSAGWIKKPDGIRTGIGDWGHNSNGAQANAGTHNETLPHSNAINEKQARYLPTKKPRLETNEEGQREWFGEDVGLLVIGGDGMQGNFSSLHVIAEMMIFDV